MTKYFLYARKSTEDEERQVMSIEAQLAELQEYAKRENILITETFIESKSAKKPGREVFNEMMAKVALSKEPVGLLAWHPDRLARNSIDGGQIIYSKPKFLLLKRKTMDGRPRIRSNPCVSGF